MRIIPLITAVLVSMALFALVFEREALLAFARGETVEAPTEETAQVSNSGQGIAAPETPVIGVVALRSKAQVIDSAVVLRGETQAIRQVEVRAETSARVISEPLRKGSFVDAGDLLCRLDPGTRDASLAEARARLREAESRVPESQARLQEAMARLDEARINDNAASKLSQGGFASETRLAATQAAVRAAEAGIASAESGLSTAQSGIEAAAAAVALAEREIDRLDIHAPFEGLLESDTAELGSLLQPGALCATVIQLDPIKLVGYVPETEVNRVRLGADAGAELAGGERVQGKVSFLSRSADPTTRTFQVEIHVSNTDLRIRDGQTASILIAAEGASAHRLPQSALTLNNEGRLGVRVVRLDDTVGFVPVTLLRDDVDGIWVSGLDDQADVIVVGQDFVTEGVAVTPTYKEASQ